MNGHEAVHEQGVVMKKRIAIVIATAGTASVLAAAPAVAGLVGNSSFSQQIPVPVPSGAHQVHQVEDRLVVNSSSPASSAPSRTRHAEPGDDRGGVTRTAEPGDDRGGVTRTAEPGDDRGGSTTSTTSAAPSDDRGGNGGRGGGTDDRSGHN
jgi:hypothetical protein